VNLQREDFANISNHLPCFQLIDARLRRGQNIAIAPRRYTGTPRRPGERYPIELLFREVHADLDKQIRAEAKAEGTTSYAVVQRRFPDAYRRFVQRRNGPQPPTFDC
jgi:hypothetical protein